MGKYEKICVKRYVEYFKKFHDKKTDFYNMFRKLNTSTEHDLKFLMLLNGNSFQTANFFARIHKKL